MKSIVYMILTFLFIGWSLIVTFHGNENKENRCGVVKHKTSYDRLIKNHYEKKYIMYIKYTDRVNVEKTIVDVTTFKKHEEGDSICFNVIIPMKYMLVGYLFAFLATLTLFLGVRSLLK